MQKEELSPSEKILSERKRYKKSQTDLDVANARRFEDGDVSAVDTYRSPHELRKKRGRTAD